MTSLSTGEALKYSGVLKAAHDLPLTLPVSPSVLLPAKWFALYDR